MNNRTSELIYSIKSNKLFYLLSVIILSAFLVIVGIFTYLQIGIHTTTKQIQAVYQGKKLYTLIDSLQDADAFSKYRENGTNINRVGQFYNALSSSSDFRFISTFNQPIPIRNFRGGDKFLYSENNPGVKCFQLNQNSFNFYNLKILNGIDFSWDKVDYKTNKIPVLLGSDYREVYNIGDSLFGNYYSKNYEFVVKGFLAPNSFVYYKGNPEFYLDQYIIIPYPPKCYSVDPSAFLFEGILYFAMINGDISSDVSENNLVNKLDRIADETGFNQFEIIGLPAFSHRYSEMVSVISNNQLLLSFSIFCILVLVIFIQHGIARILLTRRKDVYKMYWLTGNSTHNLIYIRDVSIPYVFAFILANYFIATCIKRISSVSLFSTLGITIFILITTVISCRKQYVSETKI